MSTKNLALLSISLPVLICLSAGAVQYPLESPSIEVNASEINILFPEGVGIDFTVDQEVVKGLQRIRVGETEILAPVSGGAKAPIVSVISAGEIKPVTDLVAYLKQRKEMFGDVNHFPARGELAFQDIPIQGRLQEWKVEGNAVCVSIELATGEADWIVSPAVEEMGGGLYRGISWKLRLRGVRRACEVTVEEPVVFEEGDWRLQQRGNQSSRGCVEETRLSRSTDHYLGERYYIARQQPYFFLAGKNGSKVSYFDGVVRAGVGEKTESGRLVLRSRIPVRDAETVETPSKTWLLRTLDCSSKWDALNEWTWVWDSVVGRLQEMRGTTLTEPIPILFHNQFDTPGLEFGLTEEARAKREVPPVEESWFYKYAEEILPTAEEWGFKVIELRGVLLSGIDHVESEFLEGSMNNSRSVCSPFGLEISPAMGGEKGLSYLCEKAHESGIKVVIWSPCAFQALSSPVLVANPDWLAWKADGQPQNRDYEGLAGMNLRRGFRDFLSQRYRELRESTGFDGVWQDSACSIGAISDFSDAAPYPQIDETIELQRVLQEIGCSVVLKEGCGPFGLSTRSSGLMGIRGREYLRYYFLFSHEGPDKLDPGSYFRALASKGVIEVRSPNEFEALPAETRERMVKTNFAYMKALPLMKRRTLVGEGEKWLGVKWQDENGRERVFFAFEPIEWDVPKEAKVSELMEGGEVFRENGPVQAEPWHVYAW